MSANSQSVAMLIYCQPAKKSTPFPAQVTFKGNWSTCKNRNCKNVKFKAFCNERNQPSFETTISED